MVELQINVEVDDEPTALGLMAALCKGESFPGVWLRSHFRIEPLDNEEENKFPTSIDTDNGGSNIDGGGNEDETIHGNA